MGAIAGWRPAYIRRIIRQSNKDSAEGSQRYVFWENEAIREYYEFVPCECTSDCWCKQNKCTGHYRPKQISFREFLDVYVLLWIPPRARDNVERAVLHSEPFNGRQKNCVEPLRRLRQNWQVVLGKARAQNRCGLCDDFEAPFRIKVSNLYQAKMWSQLFYDSLVPFDTASRFRIMKAGYTDPFMDYLRMNQQLFTDLKIMASTNGLDMVGLRNLDTARTVYVDPDLNLDIVPIPNGQPLSRVIDKMFYSPR